MSVEEREHPHPAVELSRRDVLVDAAVVDDEGPPVAVVDVIRGTVVDDGGTRSVVGVVVATG